LEATKKELADEISRAKKEKGYRKKRKVVLEELQKKIPKQLKI